MRPPETAAVPLLKVQRLAGRGWPCRRRSSACCHCWTGWGAAGSLWQQTSTMYVLQPLWAGPHHQKGWTTWPAQNPDAGGCDRPTACRPWQPAPWHRALGHSPAWYAAPSAVAVGKGTGRICGPPVPWAQLQHLGKQLGGLAGTEAVHLVQLLYILKVSQLVGEQEVLLEGHEESVLQKAFYQIQNQPNWLLGQGRD